MRAAFRRHRTLVAVPVAVATIVATISAGLQRSATVDGGDPRTIGPAPQEQTVPLSSGAVALLAPGAVLHQSGALVALREGSVLLAGQGMIEVGAGPFRLLGWRGSFAASVDGDLLSIASLTTPVIVRSSSGRTVVPLRSQWKGVPGLARSSEDIARAVRTLKPLPPTYVAQQVKRLTSLGAVSAPSGGVASLAVSDLLDVLRLSTARERAEEMRTVHTLSALRASLERGQRPEALALLQQGMAGVIASLPEQQLLPLFSYAVEQGLTQWFLSGFIEDIDRWLIASLHPDLRDHAWAVSPPESLKLEDRLLRLLLLPSGDVLPESPSDLTVTRWGEEIAALLRSDEDPSKLLAAMVPPLAESIDRCSSRGYPHRAQRYAATLLESIAPWIGALPSSLQGQVDRLRRLRRPSPPSIPLGASVTAAPSPQSSSQSSEHSSVSSEEVRTRTLEALRAVGAMFTLRTAVTPLDGTASARVSEVVFGTPKGDQLFTFTYDVERGTVSDIFRSGQTLPYEVSLETFVVWTQQ